MPGVRPAFQGARHGNGDDDLTMNVNTSPLTPALSPRRGEGDILYVSLPRAAFVPHLPRANISLPFQGGSWAACAAKEVA